MLLSLAALPFAARAGAPGPGMPVESGHLALEALFFRQPGTRAEPAALAGPPGPVLGPLVGGLRRAGFGVVGQLSTTLQIAAGATGVARLEELLPGSGLSGRLSVTRSQILVVHLDAHCAECAGSADIDERRRVKFGERHYFDSPLIGAIIALNPAPDLAPG